MSYPNYNNYASYPYVPYGAPYHSQGPFATGPAVPPAPQFNFYNPSGAPPTPAFHPRHPEAFFAPHGYHHAAPAHDSLEAEEEAALAQLRAIQARRRAAAQEQHVQPQPTVPAREHRPQVNFFQDFIAQAISEQTRRQREQQEEQQRRREESERQARLAREEAARVREEALRARARAEEEARAARAARAAAIASAQREYQDRIEARRQFLQQRQAEAHQARAQAIASQYAQRAARCAASCARKVAKEQTRQHSGELAELNKVLGMFGINLVQDDEEKPKPAEEAKVAEKKVEFKEPVVEKQPEQEKKAETAAPKEQQAFPDNINDILSAFLGLRVEPTSESAPATKGPTPDLSGLNNLLSQFGLVFEPETTDSAPTAGPSNSESTEEKTTATAPVEAKSIASPATTAPAESSSSTTARTQEETPLTSFLNGVTDLPPFVRDILGNLELAWKEEATNKHASAPEESSGKKDKGKGVAPGEKTERPRPVPVSPPESETTDTSTSSTTSLHKLSTIADELALVRDSFTFPSRLAFAPSADTTPSLLFNKTNSGYHAQANKLLQLLLAADGVSSGGDREVRARRKELVKAVEQEIQSLEKRRDQAWEEVKARRETTGEISEDEDGLSTGSAAPSIIDHEEVRDEHVEGASEHEANEEVTKSETAVEGFEVPAPVEEAPAAEETAVAPETVEAVESGEGEKKVAEEEKEEDKKESKPEDEYEFVE